MIKTFAQRLTPPYSGQVQIAESDSYRALTLDGQTWEIQHVNRIHIRVCTMQASELKTRTANAIPVEDEVGDPKLGELFDFLTDVQLPFPTNDHYEFWLLDGTDKSPLALLFSCSKPEQMDKFPDRAEWAALPDAVMPIKKTDDEIASNAPPVNYRFESLVSERAGTNKKAKWFNRREAHADFFPNLLVREDWPEPGQLDLCKRYIDRQAPRLLMLQGISQEERARLEACCVPHAAEVARLHGVYPEILDEALINALRVEARLRDVSNTAEVSKVENRRDGILYI